MKINNSKVELIRIDYTESRYLYFTVYIVY